MPPHPKPTKRKTKKSDRLRSEKHLASVREAGCCICGYEPSDPHHLRILGHARGLGIKNGDDYTIPLCRTHHDELHMFGDEQLFLDMHGLDPLQLLNKFGGNREHRKDS